MTNVIRSTGTPVTREGIQQTNANIMLYYFPELDQTSSLSNPFHLPLKHDIQEFVVYRAKMAAKTPKAPTADMPNLMFSALAADEEVVDGAPEVTAAPSSSVVADGL